MVKQLYNNFKLHQAFIKSAHINKDQNLIKWKSPPEGCVKLNSDGAAKGNPGAAGAGGIIRSSSGKWLCGFQAYLGICSNVVAELQGLKLGLMLAWNEGFRCLICELDAMVVIELIKSADVKTHPHGSLIADVRLLISRAWKVEICHSFREGNFCADMLAKEACNTAVDFQKLEIPPSTLKTLIDADAWGVGFPRKFQI